MVTELEEQFFKTFEVEPFCDLPCNKRGVECTDNTYCGNKYPEITDRVLLELICIANKANIEVIGETVEETKNKLLEEMIYWKDDIIHKEIQQLFKEEI